MYCCDTLKRMIENAGQRGCSIVVNEWNGIIRFWLQLRSITHQQSKELCQELKEKSIGSAIENITNATAHCIEYCPYCGTRLHKLIKKYPKEYRILLASHKAYISEIGQIKDVLP